MTNENNSSPVKDKLIGNLALALRLILGWQFASTFVRRFILMPGKMDPNSMKFLGYKFSHFMPHALLGIAPVIKYLIQPAHLELLYIFMLIFSIIELLVGLGLMLGFFSRLNGLGAALLSLMILLGSGWIGPTCLDEWQIGVGGLGAGIVLFFTGGGSFSLDYLWQKKWTKIGSKYWVKWLASGDVFTKHYKGIKTLTYSLAFISLFIALATNQAFFGGVYGKLHNPSKHPHIIVSKPVLSPNGALALTLYRNGGPDTYGAFVVKILVNNNLGKSVEVFNVDYLAQIKKQNITNKYIGKIHSGKNSLVVPLASKARINLQPVNDSLNLQPGKYIIKVMDVSGKTWHAITSIGS